MTIEKHSGDPFEGGTALRWQQIPNIFYINPQAQDVVYDGEVLLGGAP